MSVSFFGWDVIYDDDSPLEAELGAAQEMREGRVYTMYHGTSVATSRLIITNGFQQSPNGMLGPGVYVSRNQRKAERYPLNAAVTDRVVLKLKVDAGRIKRIDTDNHPMQKTWHAAGFDTAWVPPNCGMKAVPSGLEEDCVYDPKRVEVIGIAVAPNTVILAELKQLVAQKPSRASRGGGGAGQSSRGGGAGAGGVCALCRRKSPPGHTHALQRCWGCGQNICPLMVKHTCPPSG